MVGNLRLTAAGVYADYLLSGLPFIFLSEEWQNTVAADHAELLAGAAVGVVAQRSDRPGAYRKSPDGCCTPTRCLPSGAPDAVTRGVGAALPHVGTRYRRAPAAAADLLAQRPRWTVDHRRACRLPIAGRDKDTDAALADYRERAAELVGALPRRVLRRNPHRPNRSGGTGTTPPAAASGRTRCRRSPTTRTRACPARRSPRCSFDPGAAQLRGRRWRAARVRRRGVRAHLPRRRRRRARLLSGVHPAATASPTPGSPGRAPPSSRCSTTSPRPGTTLDWTIHLTFATAEAAVSVAQNVITNIRDQYRQRGPPRRLRRRTDPQAGLGQGAGLRAQTRGRRTRRQPRRSSSPRPPRDPDTVNAAVAAVIRGSTAARTSAPAAGAAARPRCGARSTRAPSASAALGEFRNPTTTERFAKFVPLLANTLGNNGPACRWA